MFLQLPHLPNLIVEYNLNSWWWLCLLLQVHHLVVSQLTSMVEFKTILQMTVQGSQDSQLDVLSKYPLLFLYFLKYVHITKESKEIYNDWCKKITLMGYFLLVDMVRGFTAL